MFKKKPEIKNLSPLRSSDRRKLADQIIQDYRIQVPSQEPAEGDSTTAPTTTLSSLRNSLLPESTSSAKFTTTSGPNQSLITGTIYVGAHPEQEERLLWFQYGRSSKLIPTVYTLWQNPDIVPLLHTPDFVVEEKLSHGSDLMVPGLVKARGSSWDARAIPGAVVAVAGITADTVPLWVGTCDVDVSKLGDDLRGQKGIAVKGLHWAGDEVWNWRPVGSGGQAPPQILDGWKGLTGDVTASLGGTTLKDDIDVQDEDGGAPLAKPAQNKGIVVEDVAGEAEEHEPTTREVDDAFHEAFIYAVHKAKTTGSAPHYGFDFPLQPSYLISNMIQPHLRVQNQHYNIKKSSWKNAKKFIKHLDKSKLLKSKDRSGGETVILDIDFEDAQVTGFRPYPLPKPKTANAPAGQSHAESSGSSSSDPSVGQKISIQTVYRASSKLVPTLLSSKTDFYTAHQVSAALKSYIAKHPELGGQAAASIKLDPFIANDILGSNPSPEDNRAIAAGRIAKGVLQKRVLEDTHLCQPYHLIQRNASTSETRPKSGPAPQIHVAIEKRTGTKVITRVWNLEPFYIDPQFLTPELQKKCAGSASSGQLTGGRPGLLEVVVQGDQRKILIEDVLARRGIDAKWVDVVDKTKGKKK